MQYLFSRTNEYFQQYELVEHKPPLQAVEHCFNILKL